MSSSGVVVDNNKNVSLYSMSGNIELSGAGMKGSRTVISDLVSPKQNDDNHYVRLWNNVNNRGLSVDKTV